MLNFMDYTLIALAALAAGAINALAGGGTLITFPVLIAMGIPPVAANMTNTVALCPGYLGGILSQFQDLRGQARRLWLLLPAGVAGGLFGALLLQNTDERLFGVLVPYLILIAAGLLALQKPVRDWLNRRAQSSGSATGSDLWLPMLVGLAAIYGGYFGAGLSVILLAVLGLTIDDSLTRLNALKQAISFSANTAAAVFFLFSSMIVWPVALVMIMSTLLGGALGGKLAGHVRPEMLRQIVVVIGVVVAALYFIDR
ncbi:MAG: sulfite exporter TauE/SafE family protein [Thermacetogeniaceae bacterium]